MPCGPTHPASPSTTYPHRLVSLPRGPQPSAAFCLLFFHLPHGLVTHAVGAGGATRALRRPHGHHAGAPDAAACPHTASPPPALEPRNPSSRPIRSRPQPSLYRAAFGDFAPKIRRRPCIDAPWGIPSCCHRNPGEEGEMGGVERADRRAQAPCLSHCS
jgi:hypothetical protein